MVQIYSYLLKTQDWRRVIVVFAVATCKLSFDSESLLRPISKAASSLHMQARTYAVVVALLVAQRHEILHGGGLGLGLAALRLVVFVLDHLALVADAEDVVCVHH